MPFLSPPLLLPSRLRPPLRLLVMLAVVAGGAAVRGHAHAETPTGSTGATNVGPVTKEPLPRFVSLRPDTVNLREGPGVDYRIAWVFKRAGLPVEITAEFDTWRKIRDAEGSEGWVMRRAVSARRTVLVAPWSKESTLPLYARDNTSSDVVARLQPGVLGNVVECSGQWCRVDGDGFSGWIAQEKLWGVYPGEPVKGR